MQPVLYKFLNGRISPYLGFKYRLRRWMPPVEGNLEPCYNGYHALKPAQLSFWIWKDLYTVKYRGDINPVRDKVVCRQIMLDTHLKGWNEATARLAATDFVYQVLPIWEAHYPEDTTIRRALLAARDLARGKLSDEERRSITKEVWTVVDRLPGGLHPPYYVARAAGYTLIGEAAVTAVEIAADCRKAALEGYQYLGDALEYEVRKDDTSWHVISAKGQPMSVRDSQAFVYWRLAELFGNIILDYAYNGDSHA